MLLFSSMLKSTLTSSLEDRLFNNVHIDDAPNDTLLKVRNGYRVSVRHSKCCVRYTKDHHS